MKAVLDVDGQKVNYPEDVFTLEELLIHLMELDLMQGRFVFEVKVDGNSFSEAYEHESREIELNNLSSIEISTRGGEEFAETGLEKAPVFISHLISGFKTSIRLLKDPLQEEEGYDMLSRSIQAFQSLKGFVETAKAALDRSPERAENRLWNDFNQIADHVLEAQEEMDVVQLTRLLEKEMIPFLERWKEQMDG